jgi:hypothetical protein
VNLTNIYVCPGSAGYEFSPNDRKVDARLLNLLTPTASELQESDALVPILRADWLQSGWLVPKKDVVAMVGLRARLPASAIQRGSSSVWAVATVFSVHTTPTLSTLRPRLVDLTERLQSAIFEREQAQCFSNLTHLELQVFEPSVLETAIKRLKDMAATGLFPDRLHRVIRDFPLST